MTYVEVLMSTIQKTLTTNIKIHKLDDNVIMEIFYDAIVDSIIDDLGKAGYTIISKQQ
jgi:hypothetical protein